MHFPSVCIAVPVYLCHELVHDAMGCRRDLLTFAGPLILHALVSASRNFWTALNRCSWLIGSRTRSRHRFRSPGRRQGS